MGYNNIKGIFVEIGGDTSGLQKALKSVYAEAGKLERELQTIDKALKFDPKNTTLLSQKQQVLQKDIAETTQKLNDLKTAQEDYKYVGGDLNSSKYRALQREIIETENKLKSLKVEASNWTQVSKKLEELGNKMKSVGDKVTSLGKSFSVVSAGITAVLGAGVKYNADIEKSTKAFETFLGSAEEADKAISAIKKQSSSSIFDTKELIQANQMLITTGESADDSRKVISSLADAIALTGGGNDELNRMAVNLQQIKNVGKASSQDIKQFAMAGIDIYGILAETTGKTVAEVKEMDITYEQVSQALNKAASEGGKYYKGQESMANTLSGSVSKLKKTFQELAGEMAQSLMPTITKLTSKIQGLADKFKSLSPEQKAMITKIALIVAAIGPLLIIVGKMISLGGTVMLIGSKIAGLMASLSAGTGALSAAITVLTGPVGIIIGVLTALVAIFVALWNKSETFRNSIIAIGESMVNTFNEHIKPAIDDMMTALGTLWNDILMPIVEWIASVLGPVFAAVFTAVGQVVGLAFERIAIAVQTVTGIFKGLIDFIAGVFTGDWERAWGGISKIFESIFNGLKGLLVTPLNWIIDKMNDFIWHVNQIKIPDNIPGVGGVGFNFPYLNSIALAKGGIVTQPTNALIGEGKSAEAVIPLDRTLSKYLAEALKDTGGVGGITVNFYPQKMTDAELDNAFNYINRRFGLQY